MIKKLSKIDEDIANWVCGDPGWCQETKSDIFREGELSELSLPCLSEGSIVSVLFSGTQCLFAIKNGTTWMEIL